MDTAQRALDSLTYAADAQLVAAAKKAVADGTHEWVLDPEYDDVIGLMRVGSNRADVIVYAADDDFEVSDEFSAASL